MSEKTGISWTDSTWNPVTGCTKISLGCQHCYAEVMAHRLQAMGQPNYRNGFAVTLQEQMLKRPLEWKKPQVIFVNSMSDLFHEEVPLPFIRQVFGVMQQAHWHQFQILTKRAQRLAELAPELPWPESVWMGVSVESGRYLHRVDELRRTPAAVKFLSFEPLLGPIPSMDLDGINWVIVGCESGPGRRPCDPDWVRSVRDQCQAAEVPFFLKQLEIGGKVGKMPELDGRTWAEFPHA